jgi:hypothetical protein
MMRYSKLFAGLALALGMALSGTILSAAEWQDSRHINRDYAKVQHLRYQIALDRQRLNEDNRCGRYRAAAEDASSLSRHQRALDAQLRDIRRDKADMYRNHGDYSDSWRER